MTHFYPLPPDLQGNILYVARMLVGFMMVLSITLSFIAIRRGNIASHRAWIIRGYAIGQGAGTQVLVMIPYALLVGTPDVLTRDLLMCLAWVINIALAEWFIGKNSFYHIGRAFWANRPLFTSENHVDLTN
jgi:hypothetical protein